MIGSTTDVKHYCIAKNNTGDTHCIDLNLGGSVFASNLRIISHFVSLFERGWTFWMIQLDSKNNRLDLETWSFAAIFVWKKLRCHSHCSFPFSLQTSWCQWSLLYPSGIYVLYLLVYIQPGVLLLFCFWCLMSEDWHCHLCLKVIEM